MKKVLVGLLVGFMIVSQVQAMGWRDGKKERGFDRGKMTERVCRELKLSDEQKDKFMNNNKQMQVEMKKHHAEVKNHLEMIRQELKKDSPDRGKISREINKVESINAKIHLKRIDSLLELKKTLTPEQRERFNQIGKKMYPKIKENSNKGVCD